MIWISLDRKFDFKFNKSKLFIVEFNAYAKIQKLRSANSDFIESFEWVIYLTHTHNSSGLFLN